MCGCMENDSKCMMVKDKGPRNRRLRGFGCVVERRQIVVRSIRRNGVHSKQLPLLLPPTAKQTVRKKRQSVSTVPFPSCKKHQSRDAFPFFKKVE